MDGRARFAVVLLAGYLLGRTKKMKLALTVAGALGGKQLVNNRKDILGQVTKVLDSSPEAKRLVNEVAGTLVQAARGAAMAAASKGVNSLSGNLQERAEKLRAPQEAVGDVAGAATGTAGKAAKGVGKTASSALGRLRKKRPEAAEEEEETTSEKRRPRAESDEEAEVEDTRAEEEPEEEEPEEEEPEEEEPAEAEAEEPEEKPAPRRTRTTREPTPARGAGRPAAERRAPARRQQTSDRQRRASE